ncbi:type II toxin-antitoxin system RatA family toxin [Ectothiorhodospiraceae bacterium 2226]|nr:type II toxin-antitoxin system RatA family toxin [Ectothiorhodospiraceae bacterium 2226]
MTTISKSALVQYTPAQMFAMVDRIEDYPAFIPWCESAEIHERLEDEVRATLRIAHSGIRKSFTTRNRTQKDKMIEMRLVEGPFRRLEGYWRFDPLGDSGCKVSFDISFEFSSRLVGLVFGPVFSQIANTLVDVFIRRAHQVYGNERG